MYEVSMSYMEESFILRIDVKKSKEAEKIAQRFIKSITPNANKSFMLDQQFLINTEYLKYLVTHGKNLDIKYGDKFSSMKVNPRPEFGIILDSESAKRLLELVESLNTAMINNAGASEKKFVGLKLVFFPLYRMFREITSIFKQASGVFKTISDLIITLSGEKERQNTIKKDIINDKDSRKEFVDKEQQKSSIFPKIIPGILMVLLAYFLHWFSLNIAAASISKICLNFIAFMLFVIALMNLSRGLKK
ncbi:hypothetical protein V6259_18865 [Marinomonas sp. TI.3.20]|uniref:hypothetical protein n=1 Tax=Marinomonas sp. TI.3.20 TaxID=3121296 RepID=UPI00311DCFE2